MKTIKVEKLTLNFGSGKEQAKLDKGVKLIQHIAGVAPVKTVTNKRIPNWGLRPGLPVGCRITLRGEKAMELIPRLLKAKKDLLAASCFDGRGNISFGIPEYIEIPGVEYDPKIGIMGLQASITLKRPGYRVKSRRMKPSKVGKKQMITKEEAMDYMKKQFSIAVGE
jgi:large subunit ribosomal protein L5